MITNETTQLKEEIGKRITKIRKSMTPKMNKTKFSNLLGLTSQ